MDQKHRDYIVKHIDVLVECTDYTQLMESCVRNGLFSTEMRKNIEQDVSLNDKSEEEKVKEKHKNLFRKITKRGPTAYQQIKEILINLQMFQAERVLSDYKETNFISISAQPYAVNNTNSSNHNGKKPPANDKVQRISEVTNNNNDNGFDQHDAQNYVPLRVERSKSLVDESEKVYKMVSKKRGVLFMVNIINFADAESTREGADNDHRQLKNIFKQLKFSIYFYKNLKKKDFVEKLKQVLVSSESRDSDCFVLILMTHGKLDNNSQLVQFSDSAMDLQEIYNLFKEDVYKKDLTPKPKVFLFPFCRGPHIEKKVKEETESFGTGGFYGSSSLTNTLVCYASSPGFKSHRDITGGNWYIQVFCKVVSQYAHNTELEDMVKKVQEQVNEKKTENGYTQICCYENKSFNKKLYFNPGLYKDEQNKQCEFEEIFDNNEDTDSDSENDVQVSPNEENNILRKRKITQNQPLISKNEKLKTDYI